VMMWLVGLVAGMTGLAFASVPLYDLFCRVTGFGGTPMRAEKMPETVSDRTILIRFDANVTPGMPWTFEPVQRTMEVKIGENALAFYRATNTAAHAVKGSASYNVSPDTAGAFFGKIECFCLLLLHRADARGGRERGDAAVVLRRSVDPDGPRRVAHSGDHAVLHVLPARRGRSEGGRQRIVAPRGGMSTGSPWRLAGAAGVRRGRPGCLDRALRPEGAGGI